MGGPGKEFFLLNHDNSKKYNRTRNKEIIGKHRIILYCESRLFARGKSVSTEKCTGSL